MTKKSLEHHVQDIALALMEGLNSPRSLTVAILIRYSEWDQLVSLRADPSLYNSADDYFRSVAATDFLRKYPDFELSHDPKERAMETWLASEKQCYLTNERLSPLLYGGSHGSVYGEAMGCMVQSIRQKVIDLIGEHPPSTFNGRFGPGATVSDKSRMSTIPDKMSSVPTFTTNAVYHLFPWIGTEWSHASSALGVTPQCVRGNVYFGVPKDAVTERGCAKGPSLNAYYQLGLGRVMRKRLKHSGLNLQTGANIHKRVACAASISGRFATIDLSSASDTICKNLVKLLLPRKWTEVLESLRENLTLFKKQWVYLEKFSAMGNGFTFELETTIFAAIAAACFPEETPAVFGENLFVYGDDIIVPDNVALDVLSALKFFGFTPNQRKTFTNGRFRESCGGDYYDGSDVRPHSLDETPSSPEQFISLANGIRRLIERAGKLSVTVSEGLVAGIRRAWFRCLDSIPSNIRACRGPEDLGDLVIHDVEDKWVTRWRASGIRYVRVYRPARFSKIRWEGFAYCVQFATALYLAGGGSDKPFLGPDSTFIGRDSVTGYKVGWSPFS